LKSCEDSKRTFQCEKLLPQKVKLRKSRPALKLQIKFLKSLRKRDAQ